MGREIKLRATSYCSRSRFCTRVARVKFSVASLTNSLNSRSRSLYWGREAPSLKFTTWRVIYRMADARHKWLKIRLTPLEFINFNRNGIRLPRETFSISKAKTQTLCDEQTRRNLICLYVYFYRLYSVVRASVNFRSFSTIHISSFHY